jgi:hypothetical protein
MKMFGLDIGSRQIAFFLLFSALALLLFQFNFAQILGVEPSPSFTFFQFIGPIAGGILGPIGGVATILTVSVSNFILTGQMLEIPVIVSFFTMAFAALYFGTKNKLAAIVGPIAMVLFWLHPEGNIAWIYSLFWVIPVLASFYKKNLFARSLGSTFTAHAIGSVAYLYAFNIPAEVWFGLIPIVAFERLLFAAGISVSFVAVTTALKYISARIDLSFLNLEEKYSLMRV